MTPGIETGVCDVTLLSLYPLMTKHGDMMVVTRNPLLRCTWAITMLLVIAVPLPAAPALQKHHARKVILLIGDGMGYSEITLARDYYYGAAGRLEMDALPYTGSAMTYSLQENDPKKPNYVTDSAAGGTAWATGQKTSNGRISTAAHTNAPLKTILEVAQANGLRTGNITTAELTDATPAVLGSHVRFRSCQGPADMSVCPQETKADGGPGSIAEQLLDHKIDVLMGGGRSRFEQTINGGPYAGKSVLDQARLMGYTIVENAEQLKAVPSGRRVLGLFDAGNMALEWSGEPATPFPGSGPQRCREDMRPLREPSLADMTRKAIQLLDRGDSSARFFLQVEGAQIDKSDHAARPCEQIGETIAFDRAIEVALDYAKSHPDTLIIVTSDHAHTSQIIPVPEKVSDPPPGLLSTLITKEDAKLTVGYATSSLCCSTGHMMEHTGSQVRLAAFGPGAEMFMGHHDMTEVFTFIKRALAIQ